MRFIVNRRNADAKRSGRDGTKAEINSAGRAGNIFVRDAPKGFGSSTH